MAKRKIIRIDEEKCNGCGLCIPNCPEGALQIIDGKARLISELFCDGLGACIGHCPQGAISVEEREAEAYDEKKVMENIIKQGASVIKAHLQHLKEHGEKEYLREAIEVMKEKGIELPHLGEKKQIHAGCPGTKIMDFSKSKKKEPATEEGKRPSQLRQWPIQLHLVSPHASYYKNADVLLSADCVAYSLGDFHKDHLKAKSLAIACPKLDEGLDIYVDKIKTLIDDANINTLIVMTMQVPCCMGLLELAKQAAEKASRKIPIKHIVVGIEGDILKNEWLNF
jgi:NAD-dependent dihydropyrimidine dehydrogenase PreA subunit